MSWYQKPFAICILTKILNELLLLLHSYPQIFKFHLRQKNAQNLPVKYSQNSLYVIWILSAYQQQMVYERLSGEMGVAGFSEPDFHIR